MQDKLLLDSDFCNLFTNIKNTHVDFDVLFTDLIVSLEKKPYIHEYLVKNELLDNPFIQKKVKNGEIGILQYSDFLCDDDKIKMYEIFFKDFYKFLYEFDVNTGKIKKINGQETVYFDIFSDHIAGKNLGEIHSLVSAFMCNIPLFLSDDSGAKELVKQKINTVNVTKIIVLSIRDIMNDSNYIKIFNRNVKRIFESKLSENSKKE